MRRTLIVTGGQAPAVVTETVWALAKQRNPPFWPDRLILVVTASVKVLYTDKLRGSHGKLALLSRELGRSNLDETTEIIATDCKDIRSDADAIAFGDKVCEVVQRQAAERDSIVHLSLAGGRKTMSFHGGAALTLFGRPQDELSHVLVHPAELERADADFWWPGHNKPGRVELALIPFVRARRRIPDAILNQPLRYADYVAQVNAAIEGRGGVVLELLVDSCQLRIAGIPVPIKLEPQQFHVYRLLAEWAKKPVPGCGREGAGSGHSGWINADMIKRPHRYDPNPIARLIALGGSKRTYRADTREAEKGANAAFGQHIARVRTILGQRILDKYLAERLLAEATGGRTADDPPRYGIDLASHEIVIRASEDGPELEPFVRSMQYRADAD